MNRKKLLDTLELIRPALRDDMLVPMFTNFCFEGGLVYGHRDELTISAPCEVTDTFAVNGKIFLEFLKSISVKEIDLDLDGKETATLKGGKSKIKLPYQGKDEFLFEEPEDEKWSIILDIDQDFLEGLELCLVTASTDSTMPAWMGITVKGGDETYLYSCDGDGLSRYNLNKQGTKNVQHAMPNEFCEAILRIAEKTGCNEGQLYVNGEWAVAEFGNNFRVLGRIITSEETINFSEQIKKTMKREPKFLEIPESLAPAIGRARILADPESKHTTLGIAGSKMLVYTETHMGVSNDSVKIDKGHPDIEVNVSSKLIHRALDVCDEFALTDDCTAYRKGEGFLLIFANYENN